MKTVIAISYAEHQDEPYQPDSTLYNVPDDTTERDNKLIEIFHTHFPDEEAEIFEQVAYSDIVVSDPTESVSVFFTYVDINNIK